MLAVYGVGFLQTLRLEHTYAALLEELEPEGLLDLCVESRAPEDLLALSSGLLEALEAIRGGYSTRAKARRTADESFDRLRALLEHPWWESGLVGFCDLPCLEHEAVARLLRLLEFKAASADELTGRCVASLRLIQIAEHHPRQTVGSVENHEQAWLLRVRHALAEERLSPQHLLDRIRGLLVEVASTEAVQRRRLINAARGCDEQGLPRGDPIPPLAVFDRADRWRKGLSNLQLLTDDFEGRQSHYRRFDVQRMERWDALLQALEVGASHQGSGRGARAAAELERQWTE